VIIFADMGPVQMATVCMLLQPQDSCRLYDDVRMV